MQPTNDKPGSSILPRRAFIATGLKAAGAGTLLALPGMGMATRILSRGQPGYTVQGIIDTILKEIPGAPFKQTVDTLKSGSPGQPVTAVVTTMFATVAVIREAASRKANFIIAHEPTFYNHLDDTSFVPDNRVVHQKQELLDKLGISVWRFHDYWHAYSPDGIGYGVLKAAGWLPYYQPGKMVLSIPALTLQDLVSHLKRSLSITHLRVIGDLSQVCQRIGLLPGAAGGQMQITLAEKEKPDVLIVGELQEWETAEYIRDARLLGSPICLIILGHSVSEEPGMQWLAEWLPARIPGLPVSHIASGEPFTWL